MCNGGVRVRFAARCTDPRPGELRVVGAHTAFGGWQPRDSPVVLKTSDADFPTWYSEWVVLPQVPEGSWEYKYVGCGSSSSTPFWEEGQNRRLSIAAVVAAASAAGCSSGVTVMEIFGSDAPAEFLPAVQTPSPGACLTSSHCVAEAAGPCTLPARPKGESGELHIRFETACLDTRVGETLHVVGDIGVLGHWSPAASSVGLCTSPDQFPVWTSDWVLIPPGPEDLCFEYKYVIRGRDGALRWESISNRQLRLHKPASSDGPWKCRITLTEQFDTMGAGCASAEWDFAEKRSSGPSDPPKDAPKLAVVGTKAVVEDKRLHNDRESELWRASSLASTAAPMSSDLGSEDSITPSPFWNRSTSWDPLAFNECYALQECLGQGAFGVVHRCLCRDTGREFAVKVVDTDCLQGCRRTALLGDAAAGKEGEIKLHGLLPPHGHIVGLHDCFHEPRAVRLVVDLCRGGDLYDAIARAKRRRAAQVGLALSEVAAAGTVSQVLAALAFCHDHGVIHRDVKPENVLLASPEEEVPLDAKGAVVKLCDFGLAARCWAHDGPALSESVGSPHYVAPEIARHERYGQTADVWSTGVLLFACIRGHLPFPARTDREAVAQVKTGNCVYDGGWARVAPGAKACVQHLLQRHAADRPTAREAQEHEFLRTAAPPRRE